MKCDFCHKKVRLITFICKCEYKTLCTICKYPETHHCKVIDEIRENEKNKIKTNNPVISSEKIIKI